MWYSWTSIASFDQWHQIVVNDLNLPRIGINAANGELQPEKQQTTEYTALVDCGPNDYRAFVEDSVAEQFPTNLGTVSSEPDWLNL